MNFDKQEHHAGNIFRNPEPGFEEKKFTDFLKWVIIDRLKGKRPPRPSSYNFKEVYHPDSFRRQHSDSSAITWIGHSSFLITLNGVHILTDPVWSDRASPSSLIGPKRSVTPGIPFSDLPKIDIVLISHDHYDHLDLKTIKRLGNSPRYFIPENLGSFFHSQGITNISEHDWWESGAYKNLRITATPAQHFSGRSLTDRNRTLWCGWVIRSDIFNLYFCGDSGYFSGFREIGRRLGPFDFSLLPIGAYLPRWFMQPVHMSPEEAIQAWIDLGSDIFIATHWGTFDLADEPLNDPPEKLYLEISRRSLNMELFWVMQHGETRSLDIKPDLPFRIKRSQREVVNK
jgi:N-acyl-phosphatidylethanolamine-hydrolysing phospholipase D